MRIVLTSLILFVVSATSGRTAWTNQVTDHLASPAELARWKTDLIGGYLTTHTFTAGKGICLDAPLLGSNLGSFATNWSYLTLSANTVYRITLTMNGTQTTKGKVPLWDFLIENFRPANWPITPNRGINAYNLDQYYYDVASGANAIINSAGGTTVTIYFTPLAVQNAQWNKVMFIAPRSAEKDAQLRFRMLDVDGVGHGQNKSGAVCITGCAIDSIPYNRVTDGASHANITSFVENNAGGTGNCRVTTLWGNNVGTNVSFTGGIIKLTPNAGVSAGQSLELTEINPAADMKFQDVNNLPGGTSYLDDWPIPWQDDKVLKLEVGLSAPTATDAAHPWDAIQLGFQQLSNELIGSSYVTSSYYAGAPQTGIAQQFIYLFSTNKASDMSMFRQMRWRVMFVNNTAASFPSNNPAIDSLNTGAVQMHYLKVNEITFEPTSTPAIEMVDVATGTFTMGRTDTGDDAAWADYTDEIPRHQVTLSAYQIGKYEVTNGQFAAVLNWAKGMGYLKNSDGGAYDGEEDVYAGGKRLVMVSNSHCQIQYSGGAFTWKTRTGTGDVNYSMEEHPMTMVTWYGCVAFCNWLSEKEGKTPCYNLTTWALTVPYPNGYRLTTEAEWERAAAWDGSKHWIYGFISDTLTGRNRCNYFGYTNYSPGDVNPLGLSDVPYTLYTSPVGWFNGANISPNGGVQTVDSPSPVGCYDMSGNVFEWCHDWRGTYSSGSQIDPTGPVSGTSRVVRGGAWNNASSTCRSAYRNGPNLGYWSECVGFRLARTP